jgi:carbon monoxide dehydrogenase subunit G
MLVEGKFTLKAPIQQVWDFLMEPGTLASCIPGAEKVEAIDDKNYQAIVKQKVGPFSVKLDFLTTIVEITPPKYVKAVGKGTAVGGMGTFTHQMTVNLTEVGQDEVEVAYTTNVSMVGRLGTFGEGIMRAKVDKVGSELSHNLQEKLKSRIGGEK